MTSNIRELLDQVATFEAQSRAGLTPMAGELVAFFETARLARLDVRAFDTGAVPDERPRPVRAAMTLPLETVHGQTVEVVARVPLVVMARAVLDELHRCAPAATQVPIGGVPCGG